MKDNVVQEPTNTGTSIDLVLHVTKLTKLGISLLMILYGGHTYLL